MNVYTMRSHSCDLKTKCIVPKGCLYVTLKDYGEIFFKDDKAKTFLTLFSKNSYLLKDPIKYAKALKKIFGVNLDIVKPGEFYRNTIYLPLLSWKIGKILLSEKSGLFQMGNLKDFYDGEFLQSFKKLNEKNLDLIYSNSIYPNIDELKSSLKFPIHYETLKKKIKKISQKELFEVFPGIYYNFTCRKFC
jgi:hypothetical protein